jgi:hypothetical protein
MPSALEDLGQEGRHPPVLDLVSGCDLAHALADLAQRSGHDRRHYAGHRGEQPILIEHQTGQTEHAQEVAADAGQCLRRGEAQQRRIVGEARDQFAR